MIRYGNNAVVGQSGGPTAAINASLAGVINAAVKSSEIGKVYGMANGAAGFMNERLYDLTSLFDGNDTDLALLTNTPGAALGSCRFKLPKPDEDARFYESLFALLKKYEIGYFFYIGGNDSMDTTAKVSMYAMEHGVDINVIGVPKTVDNDLCGTDHTPGFGSAAKYVATVFAELRRDTAVYTQKCVTIVEVMGRDAGWLTASSALSKTKYTEGADLIYLPELPLSYEKVYKDIERVWESHPDVLIAVSEGVRLADGTYIGADSTNLDKFGHVQLSGAAKVLERRIKDKFGCKVRSVELNTPQRCASHIGSLTDITESFGVGSYAVERALCGETGVMAGIVRKSDEPYETEYKTFDIKSIANMVKSVPSEYINNDGNGITEAGLAYLRPLIVGETKPLYDNGIPMHYIFPKL
ncbi:MAG: 6-phosphofructokinase [Clostridia bacterium]|nr:6-phosphofructokinase [Clostridia bacterium]